MPLLIHGEVTDPRCRYFRPRGGVHRARARTAGRATCRALKIVFEHITTAGAADFVDAAAANVAATITPQHLHHQPQRHVRRRHPPACSIACPSPSARSIASRVRKAATSGSPKFFLGTDSAPHAAKPRKPPAAARASSMRPTPSKAMPTVFDEEGALDRFEGFASEHGPRFYGLPLNDGTVTLERRASRCRRRSKAWCRSRPAKRWAGGKLQKRQVRAHSSRGISGSNDYEPFWELRQSLP